MTETHTINYNGGSRRVELKDPDEALKMHHLAKAPKPLGLNPRSLAFINETIVKGSELDMERTQTLTLEQGFDLLQAIVNYWQESTEFDETSDSEKVGDEAFDGLDLNQNGSVDLEDME